MRIFLLVAALLVVVVAPVWADFEDLLYNDPTRIGPGPEQRDTRQGFALKNYAPPYGYWGTGPDYGNYEWPYKGPYGNGGWPRTGPYGDRPRGRPMDALTYAPFPIAADAGQVKLLNNQCVRASWPGGPDCVKCVNFAILDDADQVVAQQNDCQYPYVADMCLPGIGQKVRVTIYYTDNGFSTAAFWIAPPEW